MKKIFSLFLVIAIAVSLHAQISVCSWNIENLGKSKSNAAIAFMANILKDYDIILIQEVVAGDGGARAVARLHDELDTKGFKWDYAVSDPTVSSSYKTERYAFIWKTSKVALAGKPWLEKKYNLEIDREPFCATFKSDGKLVTLVNFHAITKSKQPETEIKYFKFLPAEYPNDNLVFCGDFNCPQSHTVFNPLKSMGYKPIFINQKTSLKQACRNGEYLASAFDNMFYNSSKITFVKSGIIPFYKSFSSLKEARSVSDHVPIYFQFNLN